MNKALKLREGERREKAQETAMEAMRARMEVQESRIEEMGRQMDLLINNLIQIVKK